MIGSLIIIAIGFVYLMENYFMDGTYIIIFMSFLLLSGWNNLSASVHFLPPSIYVYNTIVQNSSSCIGTTLPFTMKQWVQVTIDCLWIKKNNINTFFKNHLVRKLTRTCQRILLNIEYLVCIYVISYGFNINSLTDKTV